MISAETLKCSIISAAENISKHAEEVNSLNVFPVPDGDTGTNLALTLTGCANAMKLCPEGGAGAVADYAAGELLRCARGNSGVIFSLIFKGFAESIDGLDYIDALSLANGLETGCNEAYAAIEKPTEGTMLTVIRLAASKAASAAKKGKNAAEVFKAAVDGAKVSLKSTPNLLPILKKHGVVDAGGQGLVYIMEGMLNSAETEEKNTLIKPAKPQTETQDIKYTYCTEFLINGSEKADMNELRCFLADIGDCAAAVGHSGIIKVHVHTNTPDKALKKALEIGELSDIKIDNMRIQSAAKNNSSCGMISLCSGKGIKRLLEENRGVIALECTSTMNASAGDILEAIDKCPFENVFISPNNKNTVLAAKQAAAMSKKRVWVNNSKTIPEGIAAARAFNTDLSPEKNVAETERSAAEILSGSVTYAAKDGNLNGRIFLKGEILGLEGDRIACAGEDIESTAVRIIMHLLEKSIKNKVLLIYGKDTDGYNAEKVVNTVLAKCGDIEIEYYRGGQPLYYYIISVE
ncbi:MAG: DAK2 domain-containing protein [Clostridia bacterium]|nr:DAK2 domain-containing protein [Clostridia bacterium]